MRGRPVRGLSLLNLGSIALSVKFQPPTVRLLASAASTITVPIGSIAHAN